MTTPASPVQPLSKWLQLMLAEIARKREELESARAEAARRAAEGEGAAESDAAPARDRGAAQDAEAAGRGQNLTLR